MGAWKVAPGVAYAGRFGPSGLDTIAASTRLRTFSFSKMHVTYRLMLFSLRLSRVPISLFLRPADKQIEKSDPLDMSVEQGAVLFTLSIANG